MADLTITEYTDPACPFAFSAEPFRLRLRWTFGDAVEWRPRMVVLSETAEDYEKKGLTPEMLADGAAKLAEKHGMPIDTTVKPLAATLPACRAVVAARLHAPEAELALLRHLRVRNFDGEAIDGEATLHGAANDAGFEGTQLDRWAEDPAVEEAVRADMAAARQPTDEALALSERLAKDGDGHRYTCPSYEIERTSDGATLSVPGFQPYAAYAVALANLLPGAERRPVPSDVTEVLAWADVPLATREVAEICEIEDREAREQLSRVATERPVGADGYWSLA